MACSTTSTLTSVLVNPPQMGSGVPALHSPLWCVGSASVPTHPAECGEARLSHSFVINATSFRNAAHLCLPRALTVRYSTGLVPAGRIGGWFEGQAVHLPCEPTSSSQSFSDPLHALSLQVAFTTDTKFSRSGEYCTSIAKGLGAPVFHVNGDDVEAVSHVHELAAEWRQQFHADAVRPLPRSLSRCSTPMLYVPSLALYPAPNIAQ